MGFHKVTDVFCVVMQVPMSEECALLADGWKLGTCVEEGYDLDNDVTSQVKINVDSAKCPERFQLWWTHAHSHAVCFSLNQSTQMLPPSSYDVDTSDGTRVFLTVHA